MSAKRLPGKPLLEINNLPIISHVVKRGKETGLGEVIVCTEDEEILIAVQKNGGSAILTGKQHKNGTERIYEAFLKLKKDEVDYIISLQGDEPAIDPLDIKNLFNLMINSNSEIGTLASEINDNSELDNENIVKVQTIQKLEKNNFQSALSFSRNNLTKNKLNVYHHIGIYCYKISALKKFINLKETENEKKNKLEQLRAMDNNMKINVALAKSSPIGIDTIEDYMELKKIMEYKN